MRDPLALSVARAASCPGWADSARSPAAPAVPAAPTAPATPAPPAPPAAPAAPAPPAPARRRPSPGGKRSGVARLIRSDPGGAVGTGQARQVTAPSPCGGGGRGDDRDQYRCLGRGLPCGRVRALRGRRRLRSGERSPGTRLSSASGGSGSGCWGRPVRSRSRGRVPPARTGLRAREARRARRVGAGSTSAGPEPPYRAPHACCRLSRRVGGLLMPPLRRRAARSGRRSRARRRGRVHLVRCASGRRAGRKAFFRLAGLSGRPCVLRMRGQVAGAVVRGGGGVLLRDGFGSGGFPCAHGELALWGVVRGNAVVNEERVRAVVAGGALPRTSCRVGLV